MAKDKIKEFEYTSVDPSTGKKKKGTIEAASTERAYQLLQVQGINPLKVVNKSDDLMKKDITIPGLERKASLKSLAVFCRQFALLIKSGIPMLEALEVSAEQTEDKMLKKSLEQVYEDVENGSPLSTAMEKHPKAFPELLIAIVSVGEEGGFLDQSLAAMASTYKTELELRQKVKSAMMYPMIVVGISVLVLAAMLIFVVPVFADMFDGMDVTLPMSTQILITLSNNAIIVIPAFLAFCLIVWLVYRKYRKEEWMVSRVDKWKLKVPVFGNLTKKIIIARFSSNLSMMLYAGVPLIQSLNLVSNTANNWLISQAIDEAVTDMENGRSFSDSINKFEMFPPMVKNMITVGESSGAMGTMLATVAEFYDEEVKEASENLTSAIEPLLILILGVLIGGMLFALYMPMFSLFNAMSSGA